MVNLTAKGLFQELGGAVIYFAVVGAAVFAAFAVYFILLVRRYKAQAGDDPEKTAAVKHRPGFILAKVFYCFTAAVVLAAVIAAVGGIASDYGIAHGSDGKHLYALMCAAASVGVVLYAVGMGKLLFKVQGALSKKAKIQLVAGCIIMIVTGAVTVFFALNT